jgi:hypothetical protein
MRGKRKKDSLRASEDFSILETQKTFLVYKVKLFVLPKRL